jgi:hypothetical protein
VSAIHKLVNSIWNKEELPDQWKKSIITSVHKDGDKTGCNNYRGISLEFGIPMKLVGLIKMCLKETYSKVRIGEYLSCSFPIQNGLKEGDTLLPLLFNFALEFAIRKIQENQVGLKLSGTHHLLEYAGDVNLQGINIDTINLKNRNVD